MGAKFSSGAGRGTGPELALLEAVGKPVRREPGDVAAEGLYFLPARPTVAPCCLTNGIVTEEGGAGDCGWGTGISGRAAERVSADVPRVGPRAIVEARTDHEDGAIVLEGH